MELAGLEPATSWVRFFGSSTGETRGRTPGFRGRNRGRFVPISGLLGTNLGLCPMAGVRVAIERAVADVRTSDTVAGAIVAGLSPGRPR
jgi:hypothetical protein